MTEQEWLECAEPTQLLMAIESKVSERKLRLFACACCRYSWDFFTDRMSQRAITLGECYADGKANEEERLVVERRVWHAHRKKIDDEQLDDLSGHQFLTQFYAPAQIVSSKFNLVKASDCANAIAFYAEHSGDNDDLSFEGIEAELNCEQTVFVREIFGNPFRPITIDPRWLTSNVVDLATAIYDERAFEKMPILADALMDAGCDDEEIIAHCRGSGPHGRGCWVVDLLLGKT